MRHSRLDKTTPTVNKIIKDYWTWYFQNQDNTILLTVRIYVSLSGNPQNFFQDICFFIYCISYPFIRF